MTVNDIFKLIKSPELLNGDTLLQLKKLVEEYPYFQTVRMLYLKNLQVEKDLSFPMELRKMALYAPDRKKLYFWIEKDKFASFNFDNLEEKEAADAFASIESFLASENMVEEKLSVGKNTGTLVSTDYLSFISEKAISTAFPNPMIPLTCSVPARFFFSCPPPCIKEPVLTPLRIYKNPIPFGP